MYVDLYGLRSWLHGGRRRGTCHRSSLLCHHHHRRKKNRQCPLHMNGPDFASFSRWLQFDPQYSNSLCVPGTNMTNLRLEGEKKQTSSEADNQTEGSQSESDSDLMHTNHLFSIAQSCESFICGSPVESLTRL